MPRLQVVQVHLAVLAAAAVVVAEVVLPVILQQFMMDLLAVLEAQV